MYKHFRTKEDLILAVLRLRDENFRHWLYRRIEELSDTPKGQMLALFDALSEWFTKPEFRGCMFIKASAEFQEINHPIHAQSAAHKQILQDHFSEIAEAADANDPRLLARQLLLLKEGAIVSAVLARGGGLAGDPAADAKEAARGLIDLQIPST
jgi:AcrR family transcriptional regulator